MINHLAAQGSQLLVKLAAMTDTFTAATASPVDLS
jgi:hypothetical protein